MSMKDEDKKILPVWKITSSPCCRVGTKPKEITMKRIVMSCLMIVMFAVSAAIAEAPKDAKPEKEVKKDSGKAAGNGTNSTKELSGMSIVGNDEAPKSLYIVPWKSSEIGVETTLNSSLNEGEAPVDRDVFVRQLDFYKVSTEK